jgi:hypothetical protein
VFDRAACGQAAGLVTVPACPVGVALGSGQRAADPGEQVGQVLDLVGVEAGQGVVEQVAAPVS